MSARPPGLTEGELDAAILRQRQQHEDAMEPNVAWSQLTQFGELDPEEDLQEPEALSRSEWWFFWAAIAATILAGASVLWQVLAPAIQRALQA